MAARPDQDVTGDSVNVAEGFKPVQMSIEALTQAVKQQTQALQSTLHMQGMLGTAGSNPYSQMVDGGSAMAGQTTVGSLASGRMLARTDSGLYAPIGAQAPTSYAAATNPAPAPAPAAAATPAPPSPQTFRQRAGGYLQQAGVAGFNPLAGQTTSGGPGGGTGGGGGGGVFDPGTFGSNASHGGSGSSSGLYGAIMGKAQKMPIVGQALGLVDEIQSQRQKNAYYQNIEGTNNAHGFGERWNEALGSFTTMGMFAPGEYSELYKGATALGYTDRSDGKFQSRGNVIDFGYTNKREMGMDANESLQYATMASKSASTSFQALSQVLQQVSEDAGKAGVNANLARQQMMGYYNTLLKSVNGPAALQTAGAMESFQTSMGKTFSTADMSGAYSTGMNYMVASTNGMTYNQFMATQMKNPLAAEQMRSKTMGTGLDAVITQDMRTWIRDQVNQVGGIAAVQADAQSGGPGILDQIFPDFLQAFPAVDWNSIRAILQTFTGTKFTSDTQAFQALVNYVMGNDLHKTAIAQAKQSQVHAADFNSGGGTTSFSNMQKSLGEDSWGHNSAAGTAYADRARKNNTRDPMIEAMFNQMDSQGMDQDSQMVKVWASDGPRVVSLKEAIEKFPDQLATGKASFVGGQWDKQTVSGVTKMSNDMSDSRVSAATAEQKDAANRGTGKSLTDYMKEHPEQYGQKPGTASNVNVTISLTPTAAQLFQTSVTNNDTQTDPNAMGGQSYAGRSIFPGQ